MPAMRQAVFRVAVEHDSLPEVPMDSVQGGALMIDLDALKADIATEVFAQIACDPFYAEFAIRDGTGDRIVDGVLAIIARHVVPVVTPEPDAEARDVLAEAMCTPDCWTDEEGRQLMRRVADAGLAALRARGFAVVRTADVEARTCAGCKHYSCPAGEPWGLCEAELMYAPHQLGPMREAAELRSDGKLPRRYWTVLPDFSCAAWEAIR